MDTIITYCPDCKEEVTARIEERDETITVRDQAVWITAEVAVCPKCGNEIGDLTVEDRNLDKAYAIYRSNNGLMSPKEITRMREGYRLSQKAFSNALGFGDVTIHRYERGSLQSKAHNALLQQAKDPRIFLSILEENKSSFTKDQYEAIRNSATGSAREETIGYSPDTDYYFYSLERLPINGYRAFDLQRTCSLARGILEQTGSLYVTQFIKALFFADSLSFENTSISITGLRYANATKGPIPHKYNRLLDLLENANCIIREPDDRGTLVSKVGRYECDDLTTEENRIIKTVAMLMDSIKGTEALSQFTHGFSTWKNSKPGDVLTFKASTEITDLVQSRIGNIR
jgi:putative zinc finger/helix-turn-helix YgiT family protein